MSLPDRLANFTMWIATVVTNFAQLSHRNWLYRAKAAVSLRGFTSQPVVVIALIKALEDMHFLVRCHAADALKQTKLPETEAALKRWETEEAEQKE